MNAMLACFELFISNKTAGKSTDSQLFATPEIALSIESCAVISFVFAIIKLLMECQQK
jgi:hypothetical protein